jgi:hypothetical protein
VAADRAIRITEGEDGYRVLERGRAPFRAAATRHRDHD